MLAANRCRLRREREWGLDEGDKSDLWPWIAYSIPLESAGCYMVKVSHERSTITCSPYAVFQDAKLA